MYCEECGHMNGHDRRCPNYDEATETIATCDICGEAILEGEYYYDTPDGVVCQDCENDYYYERLDKIRKEERVEGDW